MLLEKQIEARFVKAVKKQGALALKFVSPGMRGVPDRIVLLKNGQAIFAELKRPNEDLRTLQKYRKKEFEKIGFKVFKIDSYLAIDLFIQEVFGREKVRT